MSWNDLSGLRPAAKKKSTKKKKAVRKRPAAKKKVAKKKATKKRPLPKKVAAKKRPAAKKKVVRKVAAKKRCPEEHPVTGRRCESRQGHSWSHGYGDERLSAPADRVWWSGADMGPVPPKRVAKKAAKKKAAKKSKWIKKTFNVREWHGSKETSRTAKGEVLSPGNLFGVTRLELFHLPSGGRLCTGPAGILKQGAEKLSRTSIGPGWGSAEFLKHARLVISRSGHAPPPWWKEVAAAVGEACRPSGPVSVPKKKAAKRKPAKAEWRTGKWWDVHPLESPGRYTHLIRSPEDPERISRKERQKRLGKRKAATAWKSLGKGETKGWKKLILALLKKKRKGITFNAIVLELTDGGMTADVAFMKDPDHALWSLVEEGKVRHTVAAPILFAANKKGGR